MPSLTLDNIGSVTVATIDRPPANALDFTLLREIAEALPALADANAVVLTGRGKCFSAGLDLPAVASYGPEESDAFSDAFERAFGGLFALDVPVIAAINGHAIAGGTVIAACADYRLAAAGTARFGLTETLVGVPFPTCAIEPVRCSCQSAHLSEVLLFGRTYSTEDALARRLIDEIVDPAHLHARAIAVAEELGSRSRQAFAATKRSLRGEHLARIEAVRREGPDPVWRIWHAPETRQRMKDYMAAIAAKKGAS